MGPSGHFHSGMGLAIRDIDFLRVDRLSTGTPVFGRHDKSLKNKDNKPQIPTIKHKREVRCFKCGQKGHIAPNCRKQKLNVLSDEEEEYYSEKDISCSETDNSQNEKITLEK